MKSASCRARIPDASTGEGLRKIYSSKRCLCGWAAYGCLIVMSNASADTPLYSTIRCNACRTREVI